MFKGLTRCWPRHDWKPQCEQKAQTMTSSIVYIASAEELQWFKLTLYYLLTTNLLLLVMYRLLLSIVYYNGPNVFNRIYGWYLIKCVEALKILSPNGYLINLPFIWIALYLPGLEVRVYAFNNMFPPCLLIFDITTNVAYVVECEE